MSRQIRQYLGLLSAVLVYYLVHEGAHLIYALSIGVFRQINFMGVGVQVDVYAQPMSNLQMGVFCLTGAIATTFTAYREGVQEGIAARALYQKLGFVPGKMTVEFGSEVQEFVMEVAKWQIS